MGFLNKEKESFSYWFVIGLACLIIALVLYFVLVPVFYPLPSKPVASPSSIPSEGVFLSGLDIAKESVSFFDKLSDERGVFSIMACSSKENCYLERPAESTTYAWRLLAFSGLYLNTREERYKTLIYDNFRKLSETYYGPDAFWLLPQVYEGFRATQDISFLSFYYSVAAQFRSFIIFKTDEELLNSPMIRAIEAYELAQAYYFLGSKRISGELKKRGVVFSDSKSFDFDRSLFLNQSKRLLELGEKASYSGKPVLKDFLEFKQDSCWIQWAKLQLYQATGERKYLDEVHSFFSRARLGTRLPLEVQFSAPVQVHPCIQALQDLTKIYKASNFKDQASIFEKDVDFLIQNFIIPIWDSKHSPKCLGDNGFLSNYRSKELLCDSNNKLNTDASYSIFLLSRQKNSMYKVD